MLKRSAAAFLIFGSAFGATAFASDFARSAPNETGTIYRNPEYIVVEGRLARVDDLNASDAAARGAASNSNWSYVDGETGWQLKQHAYAWSGGRFVDADSLRHDAPRPKLAVDTWANPDDRYRSGG